MKRQSAKVGAKNQSKRSFLSYPRKIPFSKNCSNKIAISQVYLSETVNKINDAAKEAIASFTKADEQKIMPMGLKRYTKSKSVNTKELRRQIAEYMISEGKYPF